MNVDKHIAEITRLRREADALPDDGPHNLILKVDLLSKCLVYIGRLSSYLDGEYKRVYALRKHEHAMAMIEAKPPREAHAEIAVRHLREKEAQAYEMMQRWRNAFSSTTEEIHALKLRLRIDMTDGSAGDGIVPTSARSETAV